MTHIAGRGQDQSRARTLLGIDVLAQKHVVLVGVGSGGAPCAQGLAMAGVGSFTLFDRDRLTEANIPRHVLGRSSLYRFKTRAMREQMLEKNAALQVATYEVDVEEHSYLLEGAIADADLVIAGTDGNSSRQLINQLCLQHEKVALYGRAMARACGGDVLRVRPGVGPCYQCVLSAVWSDRSEEITESETRDGPGYGYGPDEIVPGLAMDIFPISNMIVRLALLELSRGTETAVAALEEDLTENFYLWVNRREAEYQEWPPMRTRLDGAAILRWYGAFVPRNLHCPACGDGVTGPEPTEEDLAFFR